MSAAATQKLVVTGSAKTAMEIAAPTKGAVEKYAPVRAVPNPRSASTNSTKLKPYPRKPINIADESKGNAGTEAPSINASEVLTQPATSPLLPATNRASDADTLRVRLLSMAQAKQAPARASGPNPEAVASPVGHANTAPPATIRTMPSTMRRSVLSLNTSQASTAVSTASRFRKRDAVAAVVFARPTINRSGPSTPPNAIAPSSQGHSCAGRPAGSHPRSRTRRVTVNPNPLPKYSKPANRNGNERPAPSPMSCLANGVLAPNKMAAPRAGQAARCKPVIGTSFCTCNK